MTFKHCLLLRMESRLTNIVFSWQKQLMIWKELRHMFYSYGKLHRVALIEDMFHSIHIVQHHSIHIVQHHSIHIVQHHSIHIVQEKTFLRSLPVMNRNYCRNVTSSLIIQSVHHIQTTAQNLSYESSIVKGLNTVPLVLIDFFCYGYIEQNFKD